jgi:site-specific DNA-methyltransferase (adenine-specific)
MLQGDMKNNKEQRIHPTQKPVALYKWLLSKYAKPGWKILDTHLGSGSHAVACYDMGFQLTACEIDKDYFTAAGDRLRQFAAQKTFDFEGENGIIPVLEDCLWQT